VLREEPKWGEKSGGNRLLFVKKKEKTREVELRKYSSLTKKTI
jgi:hypothetical protein